MKTKVSTRKFHEKAALTLMAAIVVMMLTISASAQAFEPLSAYEIYVLGSNGNLWLEHSGANGLFGQVPPPRQQVDGNVAAFYPLNANNIYVLGIDANLWLEHNGANRLFGQVPPPRQQVDGNVCEDCLGFDASSNP